MTEISREEAARKMYKSSYDALSPWGKRSVDHVIEKFAGIGRVDAPHNQALPVEMPSLHERIASLEAQLEDLQVENGELWQENEELKMQLAPSES